MAKKITLTGKDLEQWQEMKDNRPLQTAESFRGKNKIPLRFSPNYDDSKDDIPNWGICLICWAVILTGLVIGLYIYG
jgi:hypothetical protein